MVEMLTAEAALIRAHGKIAALSQMSAHIHLEMEEVAKEIVEWKSIIKSMKND
jgi:hypothetical protein